MKISEAIKYLEKLDESKEKPEILFQNLFDGKGRVDRTDLINLFYRIDDIDGLHISDWICKCVTQFINNPDISFIINGLTDVDVYIKGISFSAQDADTSSKNHICSIDLYTHTYQFDDSDLIRYEKLASEKIKEPVLNFSKDAFWCRIHDHISLTIKDRIQLIFSSYKKGHFGQFLRNAYFWMTVKKEKIIKVYNEKTVEYERKAQWAYDWYQEDLCKQKTCINRLADYKERVSFVKTEIRDKLAGFGYIEN